MESIVVNRYQRQPLAFIKPDRRFIVIGCDFTILILKSYLTWNLHLCYTLNDKLIMRIHA
jgi:hypothetical protein